MTLISQIALLGHIFKIGGYYENTTVLCFFTTFDNARGVWPK
jgi:hypothetical protein